MTDNVLTMPAEAAQSSPSFHDRVRRRRRTEFIFSLCGIAAIGFALLMLSLLFFDLAWHGFPRLSWDFFWNFPSRRATQAGILSAWVGSLLVIMVTALFAVGLGVSSGIYLEEYAPKNWLTVIIEINVNNLAGVPSIVYGLLALGLFVYGIGTGRSILTAGLLGEQYVGFEGGAEDKPLAPGSTIKPGLTQSAVVLEKLISQFMMNKAAEGSGPGGGAK